MELRQRMPEDAEELFALTAANRVRLREWLPWLDGCTRVADTRENIEATLRQADAGTGLAVCLWSEGRIAGVGGYNAIDRTNLAQIDDDREFRDLLDEANRANASFYSIDPRGLAAFDTPLVRTEVVDRWGEEVTVTLDALSARLTTDVLRRLDAAAASASPAAVARAWLREEGLT